MYLSRHHVCGLCEIQNYCGMMFVQSMVLYTFSLKRKHYVIHMHTANEQPAQIIMWPIEDTLLLREYVIKLSQNTLPSPTRIA